MASTKATASATSKPKNYEPPGKNYNKAPSTSNYATKTTPKADAASANTEKSAADAEHAQNTTQATSSHQTLHATIYPRSYGKTPKSWKNSKKIHWVKNNNPVTFSLHF